MKLIEQRKMRLITLRDRYETRTEKKMISLRFDPVQGRIIEEV